MADLKHVIRTVALDGKSVTDPSPNAFFDGEMGAHTFIIAATRGGEPFLLSGDVSGLFLNPNDAAVVLIGSIVDGAAVITLSDACYDLSGRFTLTISVAGAVIYECQSRVRRRSSGTAYDPDDELTVAALSTEIAKMRAATADANMAAANANAAASHAVRYDTAQTLTDAQKLQARNNIGVGTGLVSYDEAQTLTTAQKLQARTNISAANITDDGDHMTIIV